VILTIDPGYADHGNACVAGEHDREAVVRITQAWFEHPATFKPDEQLAPRNANWRANRDSGGVFDEVVIERPQQDARSFSASPATLIELTRSGYLLAGMFAGRDGAAIREYHPRDWKGSEAKPIMHRRLWAILDEAEREVLGGPIVEALIVEACRKGGLDKWSRPGVSYYSQAKRARHGGGRGGFVHNLLDAGALLCVHTGRLQKR
jgi:hypothetical protein